MTSLSMRSLSMPDDIHLLAGQIEELEERMTSSSSSSSETHQQKLQRIMSMDGMIDSNLLDDDEAEFILHLDDDGGEEDCEQIAEDIYSGTLNSSSSKALAFHHLTPPKYSSKDASFDDAEATCRTVTETSSSLPTMEEEDVVVERAQVVEDESGKELVIPKVSPKDLQDVAASCIAEMLSVVGGNPVVPKDKTPPPEVSPVSVIPKERISSSVEVKSDQPAIQRSSSWLPFSSCRCNKNEGAAKNSNNKMEWLAPPSTKAHEPAATVMPITEHEQNEEANASDLKDATAAAHQSRSLSFASVPSVPSSNSISNTNSPRFPKKPSLKRSSSICSTGSAVSNGSNSLKRNVSFHKLEIREYNVALSDHPSCSFGPPIQLGWDYHDKEAVNVEEYEEQRVPRRDPHELVLSYNVRRYLLLKRAGYSKNELRNAMEEVDRVKRQRLLTDLFLPVSKIDETVEDLVDTVKSIFDGKKRRSPPSFLSASI